MRFRFDHAVVVVSDLAEGMRRYTAAGFTVSAGGRHDVLPTENALIAFADGGYLELMAVRDPDTRDGLRRLAASDRWESHLRGVSGIGRRFLPGLVGPPGVADYALATSGLGRFAVEARRRGLAMTGPLAFARDKPNGQRLEMELLLPAAGHLPFFIDDRSPREWRVPADAAATTHSNGACGISVVVVSVPNVPAAALDLASLFDAAPRVGAHGVTSLRLAGVEIALVEGDPARACGVTLDGVARLPAEIESDGVRTRTGENPG